MMPRHDSPPRTRSPMPLTVMQLLPELNVGGVERGTVEIAQALVAAGHRALVVSAGGRMVAELERAGARHFMLPIGRKRVSTLFLVRKLRELLIAEDVDIVHGRSRVPAWIGHLALKGMDPAQRPHWVTTVHGPYTVNRYSRIMASGERVIAISEFIRDYIVRNYPDTPAERVTVIPRGVDPAAYPHGYRPPAAWLAQWKAEQRQLGDTRILTLPARLTRWKGQQEFIELVGKLHATGVPVHGLIVGGPHPRKMEFESELRARVAEAGLNGAITFLGARTDLREILAISDIAFSLTREPEAFGRTTLEALSLGTPVVGFNHGGTGEILRASFPAGLVPTGDVAAAVERTRALLESPVDVPAGHPFTLARMQAATLDLYAALAATTT